MHPSMIIMIGLTIIIALAILMCVFDFNIITTAAVGGLIASGLWIVHTLKHGVEERPYEFLAAFAWFVFSMVVFLYDY